MDTLSNQYATTTGMFNPIKINKTIAQVLLKLNRNVINVMPVPDDNRAPVKNSEQISFMKLTKKRKLFYLVGILNKLKNQIVKYNIKKLFQIWHLYHRENNIVNAIVNILFKVPQYHIKTLRKDILKKNTKCAKNKKQRDEICREICQHRNLLRVFDKKSIQFCLNNFHTSTSALKKETPLIMCFHKTDVDAIIKLCSHKKNFPIHLLPITIVKDIQQILRNKVPA